MRRPQWSSTFDPFALRRTVHRFPQIAAPLHIQQKTGLFADGTKLVFGGGKIKLAADEWP
jgi:hypothetical protein